MMRRMFWRSLSVPNDHETPPVVGSMRNGNERPAIESGMVTSLGRWEVLFERHGGCCPVGCHAVSQSSGHPGGFGNDGSGGKDGSCGMPGSGGSGKLSVGSEGMPGRDGGAGSVGCEGS